MQEIIPTRLTLEAPESSSMLPVGYIDGDPEDYMVGMYYDGDGEQLELSGHSSPNSGVEPNTDPSTSFNGFKISTGDNLGSVTSGNTTERRNHVKSIKRDQARFPGSSKTKNRK